MPQANPHTGIVLGLTGGIASGKSRVAALFAQNYHFPCIDLDQICRQLLLPEAAGWRLLRQNLASSFFTASGALDRPALRAALFSTPQLRQQVDALIHPLARQVMEETLTHSKGPVVVVEIPLLFEAGWQEAVDQILVVTVDQAVQVQRLMQRDQVSAEAACQAIAAQYPLTSKAARADYVIENSKDWVSTCLQVEALAEHLLHSSQSRSSRAKSATEAIGPQLPAA
jgi:dephospho-CoA kinase